MKREKGAITVYLSLVIVIFIAFTGGLIDASRMRAADAQVNRAVDNGTKSLLASYNADLNAQYGLFAFNGDATSNPDMVQSVVEDNLLSDGSATDLYDYQLDSFSMEAKGPLTQPEVIKEQILQNMKYRAPINLMEGIIQKLSLFKDMNKYNDTLKKKETLDQEVKKIDDALSDLQKQRDNIKTLIEKIRNYNDENSRSAEIKYQFSDIKGFIHLSMILDAVEKYQDKTSDKIDLSSLRTIINKGKTDSSTNIKTDVQALKTALEDYKTKIDEVKAKIEEARPKYDAYKASVDGATSSSDSVSNNGIGDGVNSINDGFQSEAESYAAIFEDDKSSLTKDAEHATNNLAAVNSILQELDNYSSFKGDAYNENQANSNVIGEIKQLNNKGKDYTSVIKFYNSENSMRETKKVFTIPSDLTKIQNNITDAVKKLEDLEQDAKVTAPNDPSGQWKNTGETLKKNEGDSVKEDDSKLSEKSIEQYASALPSQSSNKDNFIDFSPDQTISGVEGSTTEKALSEMDGLSGIEDALSSIRDKIFLNEYVMTRLKDRVKVEDETLNKNRIPKMVEFETQLDYEVEYILSGNLTDKSNANSVWWKIYGCRFLANLISIRGIDTCQKRIEDMALLTQAALVAVFKVKVDLAWLKALYTAAWAANESAADLKQLTTGHKVPLYKKDYKYWFTQNGIKSDARVEKLNDTPDKTNELLSTVYSDYLRMFLLIQSQDTTLSRVEDIIQVNMKMKDSSFDLSKAMTQVDVTGNASIKYMFFNLPIMFEEARKSGRYEIKINKSLSF